ncbi:putative WRKY transcription factor 65 [Dichanthelium oligosanthes]|uniref:Putative WRKY transcription factor 65 n=1 Tax=Dichanthelium oligosanthes TaxID=888268 RepID=A0A1E5WB24_9POAL|nr:putative WRKY transcription factor 65 [Dichanthelium oligosanthes]
MDGEWSDGAAVSSPTVSGGEGKAGPVRGVPADECPGSPLSPAAPSTAAAPAASGRRRSANKRVVNVPLADVSGPRPKGVGEGNTPTDSWAWRKYGQKPIKGSPFPRAYYRCSSNKGCPARKQVERNRAEPDMVIVTYSFEHNHSDAVPRAQNRPTPKPKAQPPPPPPEPAESLSSGSHEVAGVLVATEGGAAAAAAVEVHDDFRWLYDGVSVTSTSPSDVDAADEMLYGTMSFFSAAPPAPLCDEFGDVGGLFDGEGGCEEDAMFAGLGELPECAMVFRRHGGDGMPMAGGGVKVEQPAESAAMS